MQKSPGIVSFPISLLTFLLLLLVVQIMFVRASQRCLGLRPCSSHSPAIKNSFRLFHKGKLPLFTARQLAYDRITSQHQSRRRCMQTAQHASRLQERISTKDEILPSPPTVSPVRVSASTSHAVGEIKGVTLEWSELNLKTYFSLIWLRDHCREPCSFHPVTKQRLNSSLFQNESPQSSDIRSNENGIWVKWKAATSRSSSAQEEVAVYTSFYPWAFLLENSYNPALSSGNEGVEYVRELLGKKKTWTAMDFRDSASLPMANYEEIMSSEEGVYKWLQNINEFGFSFVNGIPPTAEATEALIRRIAFIRDTHYGAFWDFTADLKHGDLAYSEQALGAHTDTTYFSDPCGLQLFHLLSSNSTHQGGNNLLVDGFSAAEELKKVNPAAYDFLSQAPIPGHASGTGSESLSSGVFMRPVIGRPVLEHDEYGQLKIVRWNPEDRGVIGGPNWTEKRMNEWYSSSQLWNQIITDPKRQLWTEMEMGTAIIFDNQRVLHGRSAFTGRRRLCGAYISGDDYRSRLIGLSKRYATGFNQEIERNRDRFLGQFGVIRRGERQGAWEDYL